MINKKYIYQFAIILAILTVVYSQRILDEQIINHDGEQRLLQAVAVNSAITLTTISNTKFNGLTLYHQIPRNWTIGQTFQVKGRLNIPAPQDQYKINFRFISPSNPQLQYPWRAILNFGTTQFTLNIDTKSMIAGNYYLALYPGNSGNYDNTIYQLNNPSAVSLILSPPSPPTGCSFNLQYNNLVLRWDQDGRTALQKVTFTQGFNTVQYILSNFVSTFIIPNKDFTSFVRGQYVTVRVSSAYSSQLGSLGRISDFSSTVLITQFKAGQHAFAQSLPILTLTTPIPWKVAQGTNLRIQGYSSGYLSNDLVIQEPLFVVSKRKLTASTNLQVQPYTAFDITIPLTKKGVYILQINRNDGQAALNRPIYVGDQYPLIPDFNDLTVDRDNSTITAQQPQGLDNLRNALLALINQKRTQWGLNTLVLDAQLNNLAQLNSQDMVARNYFSHYDFQGNGPQQRAYKAGFYDIVAQNIAWNVDLAEAHYRLCRSPGHLYNIVDKNYARVGLGFAFDATGEMRISQQFSTPKYVAPVSSNTNSGSQTTQNTQTTTTSSSTSSSGVFTDSQLQTLRIIVRDWISNSYSVPQDPALSKVVKDWLNSNNGQDLMDYTFYTAQYPSYGLSASSVTGPYSTSITQYFQVGSHFKRPDQSYTKFGIGVFVQADKQIKIQVEYAQ